MSEQQQKQVQEGGNATFSVKVSQAIYNLVNILCEGLQHGTNGNDLMKMFIQTFIESAKHDGPLSEDMKTFLNILKMEPGWHKAFNFADPSAVTDIAQVILVLQQKGRNGFGLVMIDRPYMDDAHATYCVDDILERVAEVSMRGLYKMLRQIGIELDSQSLRETLTIMCDAQTIVNLEESDRQELPGFDNFHDFGKRVILGRKYVRKKHRTPDSLANSQQTIHFDDFDRDIANDEADGGEHIGEHVSPEEIEQAIGGKPFGVEP